MPARLLTLLTLLTLSLGQSAQAQTILEEILSPRLVTENIYYFKGDLEARSHGNFALNNNLGFIVTEAGVVLIDSGASYQSGPLIARAIAGVTDKPIRWVINTGSQDHRWLGNGYFAEQGAEIIALARTVATQRQYAASHLQRLEGILKERLKGTEAVHAQAPIDADRHMLVLGGVSMALIYAGDAHFPGDVMLWLPEQQVVFSGDIVYVDRLTGIHPWTSLRGLQQSFAALEALQPVQVVPGHGYLCDLAKARAESGDYYDFLLEKIGAAVENFIDINQTVDDLADAPAFAHLQHFDSWHRLNVNRSYLQLEAGQ
ncbi:MAG: MBL fold metallo-hydrolase [Chromatiales bacterium]|nr:MBL fold metallo-hydrolase [Gammaproteobacteria bacterium]MBW6477118.1 MBL fold metallo-hydrolase [Chromatiales bacterium]